MLTKKQFFVLLSIYILYMLVGAAIFYHIEGMEEAAKREEDRRERQEIEGELYKFTRKFNLFRAESGALDWMIVSLNYLGSLIENFLANALGEAHEISWNGVRMKCFAYLVAF